MTAESLLYDLKAEMHIRDPHKLRIFALTFNMAGKCPSDFNVYEQLFQRNNIDHDIYVVSTQEAERPIPSSILNPSKEKLYGIIRNYFGDKENENEGFVMVTSISLAAISMIVLVKKEILNLLSDI